MSTVSVLVCAAFLLAVYSLTAARDLTWRHGGADGGELALASQRLGVAHPPGYPLYTLLGWLAIGVSGARPVVAMEWVSHLAAVAACGLVGVTAYRLARQTGVAAPRAVGVCAALALGLSRTFWSQAIIVEVYALLVALFCAVVRNTLTQRRRGAEVRREELNTEKQRDRETENSLLSLSSPQYSALSTQNFVLGHILGLAITHHLTALLWLPGLLWLVRRQPRRAWGWMAAGGVTGFWTWALMLARAGSDPAANWGGIETGLDAFVAHITGAMYRGFLAPLSLERVVGGFGTWIASVPANFTWAGAALIVIGVVAACRARMYDWLFASALWVVTLVSFTSLYTAGNTAEVYRLPLAAVAAVYLGLGGGAVVRVLHAERWSFALPVAMGVVLLVAHWGAVSVRGDHEARNFITSAAETIPANAVVIADSDEATFALWYAEWAEGGNHGWVVVNDRLFAHGWYRTNLARQFPALAPVPETLAAWLRSEALSEYTIVSTGLLSPPPGRRAQPMGAWYVMPPP